MISVIGLGSCGCSIAKRFSQYAQYKTYYIDTDLVEPGRRAYRFPKFNSPEEYEANCPEMGHFFNDVDDEVMFIIGGSGYISGASLRLLSYIRDKEITMVYVQPEVEFLSEAKKLMENSTFHIFQEYARSGVFKKIIILENPALEQIVTGLTISNFYERINDFAVPAIHMINVFDNTEPVMSSFSELKETSRICSLGIVDVESGEEKMFFSIDNVAEKRYYFGVNSENLKTDSDLLNKIKKHIRGNSEGVRTSFAVYSTSYDHDLSYVLAYSPRIQTKNNIPDE
jgi:hypothetical protein